MSHGVQKLKSKLGGQHWNKPQPKAENPYGVSTEIMRQLASEGLATKEAYQARLQELLEQEKSNGR